MDIDIHIESETQLATGCAFLGAALGGGPGATIRVAVCTQ